MRKLIAVLPLVAVAACSGGGPESVGSIAAPAGAGSVAVNPGTGGGVGTGTSTGGSTGTDGTFLSVSSETSFDLIGGAQSLVRSTTANAALYNGNASTVRAPSGTVSYNPRDGIFTVAIADTKANVTNNVRFQDPGHRTDFSPVFPPQDGVPNLAGFNYLESVGTSSADTYTFFYQRPGESTVYVSLAGFVRSNVPPGGTTNTFERSAFVFGTQTSRSQIPATGGGTYKGGFLATMVANEALGSQTTAFQWINGSSTMNVDFGKGTATLGLTGTVSQASIAGTQLPNSAASIAANSTFTAAGTATIDLIKTGGFTGQFQSAQFKDPTTGAVSNVDFAGITPGSSTAGASSIDGAFYGPGAVNVGGSVRIVGGVPNQRVDILGAFTGAKQ